MILPCSIEALGYFLQGKAWADFVKHLLVGNNFAMFGLLFSFIVLLHHAWHFGVCPQYRMMYTAVKILKISLIFWTLTKENKI